MIRLGLCCLFREQPIKFHRQTAKSLRGVRRSQQLGILAGVCRDNVQALKLALHYCRDHGIGDFRINSQILPLYTHPDQFILLSSPSEQVTQRSIAELEYQAELAELVGADVINIHGGGAYGGKAQALARLVEQLKRLPPLVRSRPTLEQDLTVEVEAKAKELAVNRLRKDLSDRVVLIPEGA
jgi:UV DNA damage endonuclease